MKKNLVKLLHQIHGKSAQETPRNQVDVKLMKIKLYRLPKHDLIQLLKQHLDLAGTKLLFKLFFLFFYNTILIF